MRSTTTLRRAVRGASDRIGLATVVDAAAGAVRDRHLPADEREWRRHLAKLLRRGLRSTGPAKWADPAIDGIPIVICLWNRPERVHEIVSMLESLDPPTRLKLLFWNNAEANAPQYGWTADHVPSGSLASIDLVNSSVNIGGLARFVAVRWLRNSGYDGPVLMLDDDQIVAPSFVSDLLDDWTPESIVGWWAFNQVRSYWDREQVEVGAETDHVGTGGTVLDSSLVDDDRFFFDLPRRFAFMEDQWMSYQALARGWRLQKARTTMHFVLEERNQYHAMIELKDEFHRYLRGTPAFLPPRPNARTGRNGRLRPRIGRSRRSV
ncbi:hypothetical protein [Curtobacterium pusillum]|uniref:hypothetical protein n=1 Tax=Curtobacterium pusillum TaxID=69373 RepID=UPI0011A9C3EA|nr:hypothetical protein [Curtobacterium pusillum]